MTRRVLHVIPSVAPRYGGPSAAVLGMCRALEAAGVQTRIATTDADGPGRLGVALGRFEPFNGVETIFFRRAFGEAFKWSSGIARWLAAHVVEFDVVHVHAVFSHASIAAGRAARRAAVPYLVRPLGTLDPWSLSQKKIQKQILMKLEAQKLLQGAAGVHYTSDEERRLAEQDVPGLPTGITVPLGIDDTCFEDRPDEPARADRYLLALSRLDRKKGLEMAIRAFHDLAADTRLRSWKFVIAGDGDAGYVAGLRHLAETGPAANRIEFRGWVTGRDKLDLIRRSALFVSPSKQENFGLSALESMASGVPAILAVGVNVSTEVAQAGAGWQVDESTFSATLVDAMLDEAGRRERGRRARVFAGAFRWPAVAGRLIDLYERVQAHQSEIGQSHAVRA